MEQPDSFDSVLETRVLESSRRRIVAEVWEAREDFLQERCQETSIDELMKEILA